MSALVVAPMVLKASLAPTASLVARSLPSDSAAKRPPRAVEASDRPKIRPAAIATHRQKRPNGATRDGASGNGCSPRAPRRDAILGRVEDCMPGPRAVPRRFVTAAVLAFPGRALHSKLSALGWSSTPARRWAGAVVGRWISGGASAMRTAGAASASGRRVNGLRGRRTTSASETARYSAVLSRPPSKDSASPQLSGSSSSEISMSP
mmetsp:Transcript_35674/g.114813  ORF Transcript_35674/g.114813 Transcript_35674/m.114813 type:complete len:207 (+) Transcript_35674:975-1595(+)